MKVLSTPNTDIPNIEHVSKKLRQYEVTLHDGEPRKYCFSYQEAPVNEYIFKGDFAISGANFHHYYGVIKGNNFYSSGFSKFHSYIKRGNSAFWTHIGNQFDLDLSGKQIFEYNTPVNLFFNITLYWHWFNEDLPLLNFFAKNNYPIITNKLASWQKQSLEFFPDVYKRIIEVETPCIIKSPEFHTFSYPATSMRGKTSEWVSKWLQQNLTPSVACTPNKKIYISRGDAQARVVENENEVKDFLKSRDFICYDNFSSLSIQEKINLFHSAKIVLSPTGAGLTHCHAMQNNTTVIDFNHNFELEKECGWNNLGRGVGVNWHTFPAITGSNSLRSSSKGVKQKNKNLIVDLNLLAQVLDYAVD